MSAVIIPFPKVPKNSDDTPPSIEELKVVAKQTSDEAIEYATLYLVNIMYEKLSEMGYSIDTDIEHMKRFTLVAESIHATIAAFYDKEHPLHQPAKDWFVKDDTSGGVRFTLLKPEDSYHIGCDPDALEDENQDQD